jgi:hypothetical protein
MNEPSSTPTACRLFETFIDRDQAPMPRSYLPSAKGVLIAGDDLLSAAGYRARSHRPKGWNKYKPGVFLKPLSIEFTLEVRQCGSWRSNMWTIERSNFFADDYCVETLVFPFENVPIHATTYQGAMRVAEYCHPVPQVPVPGCWVRAWHRV